MKWILLLIITLSGVELIAEPDSIKIYTLRNYSSGWEQGVNTFEFPQQYAMFKIEQPCILKKIRVALTGKPGTARVRLFGPEGGSYLPLLEKDLIIPRIITRTETQTGKTQLIEFTVDENIYLNQPYYFVSMDNFSPEVMPIRDKSDHTICDTIETRQAYMVLKDSAGNFRYFYNPVGKFENNAFKVELDVVYLEENPPARFVDAMYNSGLNDVLPWRTAAWGDFNNDGWLDLMLSGKLYRNDRTKFTDVNDSAGITGNTAASQGANAFLDMNNDGLLDIIYTNVYYTNIFINNGDSTFSLKKVTNFTKLFNNSADISGFAIADINDDKYPDIFITQNLGSKYPEDTVAMPNYLFYNNQDTGFTNMTDLIYPDSEDNKSFTLGGARFADFNNDGYLDLYIINSFGQRDEFYFQTGNKNFSRTYWSNIDDMQIDGEYGWGTGGEWADYDNDGYLDLLLTQKGSYPNAESGFGLTTIFRNKGDGSFENMYGKSGLDFIEATGSGAWGDFNNDGLLDIFLPNYYKCRTVYIYFQKPDHTFELKSLDLGFKNIESGPSGHIYSATLADYDNDGKLDILTSRFGFARLFRNNIENTGNWVELDLRSTSINNFAIGAKVYVYAGGKKYMQEVSAGNGVRIQKPYRLHFGLGDATKIDSVIVKWRVQPNIIEKYLNVPINSIVTLSEGTGIVGVDDIDFKPKSLSVSPNPFTNSVLISLIPSSFNLEIEIYDVISNIVYKSSFNTGGVYFSKRIDLATLSAGVYVLKIIDGKNLITEKVIKL
jgi:hypothetical protein